MGVRVPSPGDVVITPRGLDRASFDDLARLVESAEVNIAVAAHKIARAATRSEETRETPEENLET